MKNKTINKLVVLGTIIFTTTVFADSIRITPYQVKVVSEKITDDTEYEMRYERCDDGSSVISDILMEGIVSGYSKETSNKYLLINNKSVKSMTILHTIKDHINSYSTVDCTNVNESALTAYTDGWGTPGKITFKSLQTNPNCSKVFNEAFETASCIVSTKDEGIEYSFQVEKIADPASRVTGK